MSAKECHPSFELFLIVGGVKQWRISWVLTESHTMHLKGELSPLFSSLVREVHQSPLNAKIPQWLYLANHGHLGNKFWAHLAVCMHASYTLPWAAVISCCQRWGPKQGRSLVLMGVTALRQSKGKLSLPVYVFFQLFHLQLILFWLPPSGFFLFCRASRNSL